jgi:A-kinase anchor protein 9
MLEPLPVKVGKSCASQIEGTLQVSSGSQTPQTLVRNAGIQSDVQSECSSEEVNEVISQFTEKIEQMQELHAAEILDMESRHISETETLKREHYVAIQLLTEECGSLKAVIQCLSSKEVFGSHNTCFVLFFQQSMIFLLTFYVFKKIFFKYEKCLFFHDAIMILNFPIMWN